MVRVLRNLHEIRNAYYKYRIGRYMLEHPDADHDKAYKYARVSWARKVKAWRRLGYLKKDNHASHQ